MLIVCVSALCNGAHDHLCPDTPLPLPEGWAVIPESVGTMKTLKNFPFGDITVEDVDGVPTVTSWTPGKLPVTEPETPPEPKPPTLEERVEAVEAEQAALAAAIERGVSL